MTHNLIQNNEILGFEIIDSTGRTRVSVIYGLDNSMEDAFQCARVLCFALDLGTAEAITRLMK